MFHMRNRIASLIATAIVLTAGAASAQQPQSNLAIVTIDKVQYVLPADAAKNLPPVRALIAAAEAQGMIRNPIRTVGGTINALEYRGSGTLAGQPVNVVVSFDYRIPAIRSDVTRPDGSREVAVASGDLSWDESKPGVFLRASKTPAAERLLPLWLLPPFVIHEGADSADKIKLSENGGSRELTVPVSRFKTELKATLNPANQITHTEMTVGGKLYSADFSEYQSDTMEYHVFFPHRIVQKVDGTVVADLTVKGHLPGPYAVWPIPAELKATAAK